MKTKEELNALKEGVETVNKKLAELTDDELKQVAGGVLSIKEIEQIVEGALSIKEIVQQHMHAQEPAPVSGGVLPPSNCEINYENNVSEEPGFRQNEIQVFNLFEPPAL